MHVSSIVCLDDLVREDTWPASEFVLDLVRLPIFHASGLRVGKTPHRPDGHGLKPGFCLTQFRALCQTDGQMPTWHALHHTVPAAAADYLLRHLPDDALVLGHEMAPWLIQLLDNADLAWIDLRVSPLRFGSDLIMGLRTNRAEIHAAVAPLALGTTELVAEASQMAARTRLRRRGEAQLRLPADPVVYVGQPECEPSLVDTDGRIVRASDHADTLYRLARTGPMLYLADPRAGDFARIEREMLERVTGHRVQLCEMDAYELLACDDEITLVGLSSAVLQEAQWFARKAYALHGSFAVPSFEPMPTPDGYLQIASHVLLGEALWSAALLQPPRGALISAPPRANLLRELRNDWAGYAEATLRGSTLVREAFVQAGGLRQADALRRTENELAHTRDELRQLRTELDQLRRVLDETARIAANAAALARPAPPPRAKHGATARNAAA
ncbi:hypothetical protein [Aquabacterium sp. OR-4]|uniref:hypothetical protein n=1 Tax=Aquabacterium sp. OR-4 TaxID=2978127 RepID=UPI0028C85DEF|nr:hypothetical protein [Aquabacterium sp. OR-4]MDT7836566.1 hypothetical protein [Aquabacterium sp. OR-4]